jgi:hypothetical protein
MKGMVIIGIIKKAVLSIVSLFGSIFTSELILKISTMILKIEDLDIVNMGIKLGFLTWAIFFAAIVISSLRMKKFAVNF